MLPLLGQALAHGPMWAARPEMGYRNAQILICTLCCCLPHAALAGAWTLQTGAARMISDFTISSASHQYNRDGQKTGPVIFEKQRSAANIEYGIRDYLTAFAIAEYTHARSGIADGKLTTAGDVAGTVGLRTRIYNGEKGVFSLQGSIKSAGAFNLNVSAHGSSGREMELRALYGKSFSVLGQNAFADVEIGQRWVSGARPNETPIDLTLGVHLSQHTMIMVQSFNIISGGRARLPYNYYRLHKLAFSFVTGITKNISLQVGAFFSPAGQNALVERGLMLSLWSPL